MVCRHPPARRVAGFRVDFRANTCQSRDDKASQATGSAPKPTGSVGFGQISLSKKLAEMRNAHGYALFSPTPDASNEGSAEFLIELNDALLSESFKELVDLQVEATCYGDVSKRLAIRLLRYPDFNVHSVRNVIYHLQGDWSIYAAVVVRAYKDGECVYELYRTGEHGAWVVGLDTLD